MQELPGSQRAVQQDREGRSAAPTQRSGIVGSQRDASRSNNVDSGRQSTLGDYWTGKGRVGDRDDDELEGLNESNPFSTDLC